jgi:hypothetical protein
MMMHSPVRHRQARDGALEALNVIEHMTAAQAEGEREGTLREVIKEVRRSFVFRKKYIRCMFGKGEGGGCDDLHLGREVLVGSGATTAVMGQAACHISPKLLSAFSFPPTPACLYYIKHHLYCCVPRWRPCSAV